MCCRDLEQDRLLHFLRCDTFLEDCSVLPMHISPQDNYKPKIAATETHAVWRYDASSLPAIAKGGMCAVLEELC